jgi:hypothetical protein
VERKGHFWLMVSRLRQTDVSRERIFEEMGDEFQRSLSIEELTQFLAELERARAEIATDIHY